MLCAEINPFFVFVYAVSVHSNESNVSRHMLPLFSIQLRFQCISIMTPFVCREIWHFIFYIYNLYICEEYNHSQKRKHENSFHHLSSSGTWCFGLCFQACYLTAVLLYCDIIACAPQLCNKCGIQESKCSAPFPPLGSAHTLCVLSIFNSLPCLSICSRWSFYVDTLQPTRQVSF